MNRLVTFIFLASLLSACAPRSKNYQALETRVADTTAVQSILIQADYGEVSIVESNDSHLIVDGQFLDEGQLEYSVDTIGAQISIKVFTHAKSVSEIPLRVKIQLPNQKLVKIETEAASVSIQGIQGDLTVDSVSGDITTTQVAGALTLHSNRGKITVSKSSGEIRVVGNYGAISLQNARGEIAASTIMGDIALRGPIQGGDEVRLETDHGAVTVSLSNDFALSLEVHSTSGDVTCLLPDVISSTRTCSRELSLGGGNLSIRTVSGAVLLQSTP